MKNIHAYTEVDYAPEFYPGFVSLNQRDDGRLILSVRTRGAQTSSELEMTPEMLKQFASDIITKLKDES